MTLKGRDVRPTSDRAKETLLSILSDRIRGCRFLDLFSGSGSIGLEAASRGAKEVLMVESDPAALKILQENVRKCALGARTLVLASDSRDAVIALSSDHQRFELVFLDPPYIDHSAYEVIREIGERRLLEDGGWVIAEHDRRHGLAESFGGLELMRRKKVGDTVFSFYGGPLGS